MPPGPPAPSGSRFRALVVQLKRRKVLQTGTLYGVGAFALWGAIDFAARAFGWPSAVLRYAVFGTVAGFPLALLAAWHLDIRIDGGDEESGTTPKVVAGALGLGATVGALVFATLVAALGTAVDGEAGGEDLLAPGRAAVAVLPFADLSAEGDAGYVADGVAEEILTGLQSWGAFPVVSRGSSFAFRDSGLEHSALGAALGVRYVVEGSVILAGDEVRVTARLVDVSDSTQVWADRFDTHFDDLFAVIDSVAQDVVIAIAPEIRRRETRRVGRGQPSSLEAWELVLRSQALLRAGDYASVQQAKDLAAAVLEREPGYALARVCLAEAYHDLSNNLSLEYGVERASVALQEALGHARRAVVDSPGLVEARIWYGHLLLHDGRARDGVDELLEAVRLSPSHAQAHAELGYGLVCAGSPEQGLEELATALRLAPHDPDNERVNSLIPPAQLIAGRVDLAAESARRVVESAPDSPQTRIPAVVEISALVRLGDLDTARARAREFTKARGELDWQAVVRTSWPQEELDQIRGDLVTAGLLEPE